jgi:hypothetical protein
MAKVGVSSGLTWAKAQDKTVVTYNPSLKAGVNEMRLALGFSPARINDQLFFDVV